MGEKMRKALAMLLCVFMMFELVACGSSGKAKTPDITYSYSEAKDGTITLTLSDDYEKLRNQEGCDKAKKMYGYKDVKYNEDTKSVTYTLTPEQHTAMLRMNAYNMLMIFSAMPGSDIYKNITNIQPNSELSEFVITTKSQTLTKEEKNLSISFINMAVSMGCTGACGRWMSSCVLRIAGAARLSKKDILNRIPAGRDWITKMSEILAASCTGRIKF